MSTQGGTPTRPAVVSTAAPGLIDGRLAPLSVDVLGNLRTSISGLSPAPVSSTGSTTLMTVTDLLPVTVTAHTACSVITVVEDASVVGFPTTNYMIRRPLAVSTPVQQIAGHSYQFVAPVGSQWQVGQIVGYVQLPATGSTTFSQDEQA